MNGNDTFLDVRDAHLRVTSGNVYASAFNLDQIDIVMSSNTASTVNFNNPTKAFNAASNIEVGTANLFVDTTTTRVGIGTDTPLDTLHINGGTRFAGHIIPTTNATFDIGEPENKIRDIYVDTNSLWIGDITKIAFERGKMKFKRRKINKVPTALVTLATSHVSELNTEAEVQADAVTFAQTIDNTISTVEDLKLEHWRDYAKRFDETKAVSDIFIDNDEDYEAVTASEAFMEVGSNIFTEHSLSIGKTTDPTSALDVEGDVVIQPESQSVTFADVYNRTYNGFSEFLGVSWSPPPRPYGSTATAIYSKRVKYTSTGGLKVSPPDTGNQVYYNLAASIGSYINFVGYRWDSGLGTGSVASPYLSGDVFSSTRFKNYDQEDFTGFAIGQVYTPGNFTGDLYQPVPKLAKYHSAHMYFKTASPNGTLTEKMRILNNGNVGIGTTSPVAGLDIRKIGEEDLLRNSLRLPTNGGLTFVRFGRLGSGTDEEFAISKNITRPSGFSQDDANYGSQSINFSSDGTLSFSTGVTGITTGMTISPTSNVAVDTDTLFVDSVNDRVGIGTTSPHVPLHVVGYSGSLSSARCIYAKSNDAAYSRQFHLQSNMGWNNLSIYASDDIVTGQFLVSHLGTLSSSDERIKENITDVDDASALELFRLLKPKKYQYIDKIKRGDDTVFGFIAQDVEKTMPHGTRKIEETIPNIMEIGTVTETNIITLSNFNTSDLQSNIHTLELHDKEAKPILVTIEDVIDEHSIRVDKDLSEFLYEYDENGNDITESVTITETEYNALEDTSGYIYNENAKSYTKILTNKIYVYGERIDNFLKLNKDTIWTVSTAALQEVDRQQQADKARITELESQLTAVLARLDALETA